MFPFHRQVCERRLSETGCARCGAAGFVAGTALRVRGGWRRVERIDRGDRLHVFPGVPMPLAGLSRERIWLDPFDCPMVVRPLAVPPHALGNRAAFLLQQDMRVLLHDPGLHPRLGTGHVTIRGGDLAGFRGIAPADPPKKAALIRPAFASAQFVQAAGGAWVLCLPDAPLPGLTAQEEGLPPVIGGRTIRHLDADEADAFLVAQECRDREAAAR